MATLQPTIPAASSSTASGSVPRTEALEATYRVDLQIIVRAGLHAGPVTKQDLVDLINARGLQADDIDFAYIIEVWMDGRDRPGAVKIA